MLRAVAEDREPARTRVSEIMTRGIEYCFEDDQAEEVLERMSEQQVRRLVVVDRDKTLVGIVALGDLAASESGQRVGGALEGVSAPSGHA